jgi:hypothetical protein
MLVFVAEEAAKYNTVPNPTMVNLYEHFSEPMVAVDDCKLKKNVAYDGSDRPARYSEVLLAGTRGFFPFCIGRGFSR